MQSLYLTEYIASDLFLTEIEKRNLPYEAILSDISYTSSSIPLFLLQHKPAADHLLHYRSNAIQQYDQILIILWQLPVSFLQPLLHQYTGLPSKKITIINLCVGMGSLGRKLAPECTDLTAFQYDIAKYEPLDLLNFFDILEHSSGNTYIRIPHQHVPESVFAVEEIAVIDEQSLWPIEVLSLTGYGYAGNDATIITTGANFPLILQLGGLLQAQNFHADIFALSKITIDLTGELKSSLQKTKKLIRVMDHLPTTIEPLLQQRLENFGLRNIPIQVLSPNYEKLTTIFDEFSGEQAEFDAESLGKRILTKK